MPKEVRRRSYGHDPAPRPSKRQFAVAESAEHVVIGEKKDQDARNILSSLAHGTTGEGRVPDARPTLTKKEKQQAKREALLDRLGASHSPYSKNHNRRMNRKAREQLATGMTDLASVLDAVADDGPSQQLTIKTTGDATDDPGDRPRPTKNGLIGEGKPNPLSKNQRKQVLKTERIRQKLLQSAPEFTSNPFQAIRTHAQNTLAKHSFT